MTGSMYAGRVEGWDLSEDASVGRYTTKDGTTTRAEVLPFGVRPLAVYADEDKVKRGFDVEFTNPDGSTRVVNLPAHVVRSRDAAAIIANAGGPDLPLGWAKHVVALLADVTIGLSNIEPERVLTRAKWYGDTLWAPGNGVPVAGWAPLAKYGDRADITEDAAKAAWASVCGMARHYPKMMVVLGMPFGSVYLPPWHSDTFALHIVGESMSGKTESAEMSMATMGNARKPSGPLYRTWNVSEQAPNNHLKSVGVMPVYFDESSTSGLDDEGFTRLIFNLAQGRGRLVANTDGTNRGADDQWDACILSTGEARISARSGLSGVRRRVLEVTIDGRGLMPLAAHNAAMRDARSAYGWPLKWLTERPNPEHALRTYEAIITQAERVNVGGQQLAGAMAENVAACLMGYVQLCRVVGVEWDRQQVLDAVAAVFGDAQNVAAEEGANVGERALRAIVEAVHTHPAYFPPADDPTIDNNRDRWGVQFIDDNTVGVFGQGTLRRIMREFGAPATDLTAVFAKLKAMGVLIHDEGRNDTTRRYHQPGKGVKSGRVYVVRMPTDGDADGDVVAGSW